MTPEDIFSEIEARTGIPAETLEDGPLAFLMDADPDLLDQVPQEDLELLLTHFAEALPMEAEAAEEDGEESVPVRDLPDSVIRNACILVGEELVQEDTGELSEATRALLLDICPWCEG